MAQERSYQEPQSSSLSDPKDLLDVVSNPSNSSDVGRTSRWSQLPTTSAQVGIGCTSRNGRRYEDTKTPTQLGSGPQWRRTNFQDLERGRSDVENWRSSSPRAIAPSPSGGRNYGERRPKEVGASGPDSHEQADKIGIPLFMDTMSTTLSSFGLLPPEISSVRYARQLLFPFGDPDAEIKFTEYRGKTERDFGNAVSPSYQRSHSQSTQARLRAIVETLVDKLDTTQSDLSEAFVSLNFRKLVFSANDPRISEHLTVGAFEKEAAPSRGCPSRRLTLTLKDGFDELIGVLFELGGELVEEKTMRSVKCETSRYRRIQSKMYLLPDDLSFFSWLNSRRVSDIFCLVSPDSDLENGSPEGLIPDMNFCAEHRTIVTKADIETVLRSVGEPIPALLTLPNLGGHLYRKRSFRPTGFSCKRACGSFKIDEVYEEVTYKIKLNGCLLFLRCKAGAFYEMSSGTNTRFIEKFTHYPVIDFLLPKGNEEAKAGLVDTILTTMESLIKATLNNRIAFIARNESGIQ